MNSFEDSAYVPPFLDRFYDEMPATLIESVEKELYLLLNTRSSLSFDEYTRLNPSCLENGVPQLYGLLDLSTFSPSDRLTWPHIARMIERIIAIFEPRVSQPKVIIDSFDGKSDTLRISVRGNISYKGNEKTFSFPVELVHAPINKALLPAHLSSS